MIDRDQCECVNVLFYYILQLGHRACVHIPGVINYVGGLLYINFFER